jgi:hypothetical protein
MQININRIGKLVLWLQFALYVASPLMAQDREAQLLQYQVNEAGQEGYLSRIFVTSGMMRIDQGEDTDGFILFDRLKRVIYSVDYEEGTILVIDPKSAKQTLASSSKILVEALDAVDMPMVAGKKPQHWRMRVDGQPCQEAMLIPDMMKESVAAQGEYLQLLALQHKASLAVIPMEYRDKCADAIQVFAPTALLDKGLPLRLWDINGNSQMLIDFKVSESVSVEKFILPDDFKRVSVP